MYNFPWPYVSSSLFSPNIHHTLSRHPQTFLTVNFPPVAVHIITLTMLNKNIFILNISNSMKKGQW